jgi:hypothetical protein
MMPVAMYLVAATLSVASPNTSYVHSAAQQSAHATPTASCNRVVRERHLLSMNGRGQYWHADSTPETAPGPARSFLSVGK